MTAIARRTPAKRRGRRFTPSLSGRGFDMRDENLTFIPASTVLRCLRDQMIVQPIDVVYSRLLVVPQDKSPLIRGIVRAIGPGVYPNRYDHREKHKRTKVYAGTVFRPTTCKVGDIVHLDGRATGKSAFEQFYWGDTLCLHAREEDVAGVEA